MSLTPDSEKQLSQLRLGLKLIACLVSPLLTLQLYAAVATLFASREMAAELGAALPGLVLLLTAQPLLLKALPAVSFAAFLAVLVLSVRGRDGRFLVVFAISLALHLLLVWIIGLAADLPLRQLIQGIA